MKINIAHPSNRIAKRFNRSGMTLIEISLVIALLLGLIAVVFLGIGSYRTGADKAKCKMQLAAVQKAVRAGANFQNIETGGALTDTDVFGPGLLMNAAPVCPSAPATYTWGATVPATGTPYGTCSYTATGVVHTLTAGETSD
eukprot:gene5228-6517_t